MVAVFRYKHILNIAESVGMFAKNRRAVLLVYAVLRRRRVVLGGLVLVRYFASMEYVFLLSVMQPIRVQLEKNVSRAVVSKKHRHVMWRIHVRQAKHVLPENVSYREVVRVELIVFLGRFVRGDVVGRVLMMASVVPMSVASRGRVASQRLQERPVCKMLSVRLGCLVLRI